MIITVPLEPQEEARLVAVANERGVSTGVLVREALDNILGGDAPGSATPRNRESRATKPDPISTTEEVLTDT